MANPPNFIDLARQQRLAVNNRLSFNSVINDGSPVSQSVAVPPASPAPLPPGVIPMYTNNIQLSVIAYPNNVDCAEYQGTVDGTIQAACNYYANFDALSASLGAGIRFLVPASMKTKAAWICANGYDPTFMAYIKPGYSYDSGGQDYIGPIIVQCQGGASEGSAPTMSYTSGGSLGSSIMDPAYLPPGDTWQVGWNSPFYNCAPDGEGRIPGTSFTVTYSGNYSS